MERCAKHDPLWFCVWNKRRLPEQADEWRACLMTGMDKFEWMDKHPEWFVRGYWDDDRYAIPVQLTDAGREALENRELYDMEPVSGGFVEPGYVVTPLPPSTAEKGQTP